MVLLSVLKTIVIRIINVASSAAYQSVRFVVWLSKIPRKEYAGTDVQIQTVCPMLVATKKMSRMRNSLLVPDAAQFVKSALNSVGHGLFYKWTNNRKSTFISRYFWHEIRITYMFGLAPTILFNYYANQQPD